MKISSRFSIAVHIVLTIALLENKQKMTSDFLASCISVHPVAIRRILGRLKKAGLVDVKAGEGGAFLVKDVSTLTLFDIYQAVDVVEDISLFNSHKQPDLKCPVDCLSCPRMTGGGLENGHKSESCGELSDGSCCLIHNNIENHLFSAQKAMEESLKGTTIQAMILELFSSEPKD